MSNAISQRCLDSGTAVPCETCGVPVIPGATGVLYPPPPWAPDSGAQAECDACIIAAELDGAAMNDQAAVDASARGCGLDC